ncbi:MAG: hypothetical protein GC160_29670 [Acidobacteria bacterium]|nr:hypothetical protein [Acidobacteriota bacterium]
MRQLKPLLPELVPQALEKAKRYRLLNEPAESESICRDILAVDPGNQDAVAWLLLSLTDQIAMGRLGAAGEARRLLPDLHSHYDRTYYEGVIAERVGKARWRTHKPGSGYEAYEWLTHAMDLFQRAEALSAEDNDDAKLRWNSCARMLDAHPEIHPEPESEVGPMAILSE